MIHYEESGTSRSHGICLLMASTAVTVLSVYFLRSADHYLALILLILICAGNFFLMIVALRHLAQPEPTFVRLTDQHLEWQQPNGLGIRHFACGLKDILAIKTGGDEEEYLHLKGGKTRALPCFVNRTAFKMALKQAAPHLQWPQ